MSIKYRRPEYLKLLPVWTMVRDVIAGSAIIKSKKEIYLPKPNSTDTSNENKERYSAYITRAQFYQATTQTLRGLVGQVFIRETIIELPLILQSLIQSVDGGELNLDQQTRECVTEGLSVGHGLLLTDYPSVESATRAQIVSGEIRPVILQYKVENIINWRWSYFQGKRYLSLLVLEEEYDEEDDGYEIKKATQWRAMSLKTTDDEGNLVTPFYHVKIIREDVKGQYTHEEFNPVKGDGTPWRYIPVAFFGSDNNDPLPDTPPMEGMANINVGHYRNSADYEEACYMIGQPTPWGSGLTEDWVKDVWKGEFFLGSRAFVPLPVGGTAGLLQATPNTMCKEAMDQKERQMIALGAKLVEQALIQRTATEVKTDSVAENSVLGNVAKNVTMAYKKSILMCMEYLNISETFEFELNTDFEINHMSSQDRAQLLAEWQGGALTWEEYRFSLKRTGLATEDDAVAKRKIDAEMADRLDFDKEEEDEEDDTVD
jgi:hypothetical protein